MTGLSRESFDTSTTIRTVRGLVDSFDPDKPDREDIDLETLAAERAERRSLQPGEIVERDVRGGLGHGGYAQELIVDGRRVDNVRATWTFPTEFIRSELRAQEADIDIIAVDGDSMIPTLLPGDRVLVHRKMTSPSPDGLYAIDDGFGISVKRLQIVRGSDPLMIRILSDNPNHREDIVSLESLPVIGRVICKVTRL